MYLHFITEMDTCIFPVSGVLSHVSFFFYLISSKSKILYVQSRNYWRSLNCNYSGAYSFKGFIRINSRLTHRIKSQYLASRSKHFVLSYKTDYGVKKKTVISVDLTFRWRQRYHPKIRDSIALIFIPIIPQYLPGEITRKYVSTIYFVYACFRPV